VGVIEADSLSQAIMKLGKKHGRLIQAHVLLEEEYLKKQNGGSSKSIKDRRP
jgi:hypothetical protein